ncbi:ATP-binding protein [Agriterribacter sp.]|uniref:ATP-binding protein n=1 Tax=Agriterribacter sp. TaxID=2821509 RepID=UPI002B5B7048|nr:ATP-binding protein [Agriterribacter sp.]HTN05387.1 ATP-binding protein [Agriterribacter sp.]
MRENESNDNLSREMSQLKTLTRKKAGARNFLDDIIIEFSGANAVIAKVLPENEKNILLRIGTTNICFCVVALTGIGYIFFFSLENWIAVIFLLVVAALFSYCLKTSFSASLLHSKKQPGWVLILKRVLVTLCLIVSLAGIAMWIFAKPINMLAKHPYYEEEYNKYRNALMKTEVSGFGDSLRENYSIADYLATVKENSRLIQINDGLDQKKREIVAFIPSYYARINYDDSVRNTFSIPGGGANKYTAILPFTFPGKDSVKTDNLYGLAGISFVNDSMGNVRVLQNYYDSIFITRSQIDSIYTTQNILKFLIGNAGKKIRANAHLGPLDADFVHFYNQYFVDNIVNSGAFLRIQSATKTWLQKQSAIDHQPLSVRDKMNGFYAFISLNESNTIFVVMLLFFIVSFLYQLMKANFKELRESKYPVLVSLYQNLESTRMESIEEGLSDNIHVGATTQISAEEKIRKQARTSLEQIKNFGTVGYYMQSGQELETAGDYNAALEKYAKGYEHFPDEYEFLKKRADVFLKKKDINQSLEYLKLYNEKRNNVTVENNLKRGFSLAFFSMNNHPFYGDLSWPLNRQMNILLGKNGYGKSHLLSILLALVQNDIEKTKEFTPSGSNTSDRTETQKNPDDLVVTLSTEEQMLLNAEQLEKLASVNDATQKDTLEDDFRDAYKRISFSAAGLTSLPGKIPVLAIADARFIDKSPNVLSRSTEHIDIRLDSAKHFLYQKPYGGVIENALYRVCQLYFERNASSGKMVIIELIENIFQELTGSRFELKKIESRSNTEYEILVSTEGTETLPIQKVSQGTFSVISIVIVIYNYLRARYPAVNDNEVTGRQAIVFIDEVDAHLHPAWQQKIVNILRTTFPFVQFFITAHSPLVVAGSRKGEVAVLRKTQKGFAMEFFENDFIGYQPEELFREIFEMESYDETYLKYNALLPFKQSYEQDIKALSAKERRSDEEEQQLKKRLNDLYYMNVVAQRSGEIKQEEEMKKASGTAKNLFNI